MARPYWTKPKLATVQSDLKIHVWDQMWCIRCWDKVQRLSLMIKASDAEESICSCGETIWKGNSDIKWDIWRLIVCVNFYTRLRSWYFNCDWQWAYCDRYERWVRERYDKITVIMASAELLNIALDDKFMKRQTYLISRYIWFEIKILICLSNQEDW